MSEEDFNTLIKNKSHIYWVTSGTLIKYNLVPICWAETCFLINDDHYNNDKIGTSFFYKSNDLKIGEQYLKEVINVERESLGDFIHSDYINSFWDNEVKKQMAKKIWIELTGDCHYFQFKPSKKEILKQ